MRSTRNTASSPTELGVSLVELMIVVAIVGILAAVAIPFFSRYVMESRISEALTNIQGILESEQAYFVRFQRYTGSLGWCPPNLPPKGESQAFPQDVEANCDASAGSGRGWAMLGWRPDGPVYFRYRVYSHHDPETDTSDLPPATVIPLTELGLFAVDWDAEGFVAGSVQPWCAVEAQADVDDDGEPVFIRGNSYNQRTYRCDQNGKHPDEADPTY